jgi:endonuclease YncB( thermonuclease family)
VTDVIGTHGCKVKLGTEEQELYYIGLAGCPADHAFYDQAVAAHRALVVGQKVTIVGDVVAQDEAGHRLAYVYLGKDIHDVRSLVSAKIIGDGLGALGNFGGNNRERMYLENLGFIAKQRKAGMWAE